MGLCISVILGTIVYKSLLDVHYSVSPIHAFVHVCTLQSKFYHYIYTCTVHIQLALGLYDIKVSISLAMALSGER